jgi:hypothetical protein
MTFMFTHCRHKCTVVKLSQQIYYTAVIACTVHKATKHHTYYTSKRLSTVPNILLNIHNMRKGLKYFKVNLMTSIF